MSVFVLKKEVFKKYPDWRNLEGGGRGKQPTV